MAVVMTEVRSPHLQSCLPMQSRWAGVGRGPCCSVQRDIDGLCGTFLAHIVTSLHLGSSRLTCLRDITAIGSLYRS